MMTLETLDARPSGFAASAKTVPCFTPGTRIATPTGERKIEDLVVGDRVLTRDNGIQRIVWSGTRHLDAEDVKDNKSVRPVLIRAGSLGPDMPERDMLVSPHHRMLIVSDMAYAHFGEKEVLVAAKDLTEFTGVDIVNVPGVTYLQILFENHQVVLADGTWTESFQPSDYSLKGVAADQREELFFLYPELATKEGVKNYRSARRALKKIESYLLFK